MEDIRWKQRFINFEKAQAHLVLALSKDTTDPVMRSGLIKTFEFTFELAWKTMKDRLEYGGVSVESPREVIKSAFQAGYVTDAVGWLDALEKRNLMTHTYNENQSKEAEALIRNRYSLLIQILYESFKPDAQ